MADSKTPKDLAAHAQRRPPGRPRKGIDGSKAVGAPQQRKLLAAGAHWSDEELAVALRRFRGYIGFAAKELGMTTASMRTRITASQWLKDIVMHEQEIRVNIAETKLDAAVNAGEQWAVALTLKTLAKERYSERQEVTGADGEPLYKAYLQSDEFNPDDA